MNDDRYEDLRPMPLRHRRPMLYEVLQLLKQIGIVVGVWTLMFLALVVW